MTKEQWHNLKTNQLQSMPPNGTTWVHPDLFAELYPDWHKVSADFRLPQPEQSLDELKAIKWESIKATRDSLETEPLPYLGKLFDFDDTSSKRLNWAISTAQVYPEFTIDWTCADNSTITLTAQDILGIPIAVAQRSNELHQIGRKLREKISAVTSREELDDISWPTERVI